MSTELMMATEGTEFYAIYSDLCPACGGPINSKRLHQGIPCSSCMPEGITDNAPRLEEKIKRVASKLRETTFYHYLSTLLEEYDELEEIFKKFMGKGLWSLQRTWAIRLLKGESFSITAPTGVGKTTLLLTYASFVASKGRKVYILVPTENLIDQTTSRLNELIERTGFRIRVVGYKSRLSKKLRENALESIANGAFDILVTTTSFLARNFNTLKGLGFKFDAVLVDDADSLLKNTKNIDRILTLLGFTDEEIEIAYQLIKLRAQYGFLISIKNSNAMDIALKIEELSLRLNELRGRSKKGQLVIASATGRQVGQKPKLFKELLNFEVGSIQNYMRNIIDSYVIVEDNSERDRAILDILKRLGNGGIVLLSKDEGVSEARRLTEFLSKNGVKAALAVSGRKAIDKLLRGEADCLVGISSYYGTLVRGIDLPYHIKYVLFVGAPKTKLELRRALLSPRRVLRIAAHLIDHMDRELVNELAYTYMRLSPSEREALRILMEKNEPPSDESRLSRAYSLFTMASEKVYKTARDLLSSNGTKYLSVGADTITTHNDKLYLVIPDALTYIQASGRTSRFIDGGMTLGLSVVIESSREVVEGLRRKLEWYLYGAAFTELEKLDLLSVKEKIERSREDRTLRLAYRPAKSVLIIVESPTKARTLSAFFGRPARKRLSRRITAYEIPIVDPETGETYLGIIVATKGHIYDLVTDEGIGLYGVVMRETLPVPVYTPIKRCLKCGEQFATLSGVCPRCKDDMRVISGREIAQSLRAVAFEVDEALIATDPDSEGEKIAWDVYNIVAPFSKSIKRIEFHEITKNAFLKALREPRGINENLVASQVYRRIADRWIGFSTSSKLWNVFNKNWLGAGRVQIPVLGWIISNYREWKTSRKYLLRVRLMGGPTLKIFFDSRESALQALEELQKSGRAAVLSFRDETRQLNPLPPLTTDELIFYANLKLGFSASLVMRLAQELFEAGLTTYHRTDSTRVSPAGIAIARSYIVEKIGEANDFYPRAWGEQGAHEAIRPTQPLSADELWKRYIEGWLRPAVPLTPQHLRLYDLIFRRFVASQMRHAIIVQTDALLKMGPADVSLTVCTGFVERGYIKVWPHECYPDLRTQVASGAVSIESAIVERASDRTLLKEGEVVRLMKERRIGRPSTYARTLMSLKRHGYVVQSKKRMFLIPTKLGMNVYTYLMENYQDLLSESRTAELEKALDRIEEGGIEELSLLTDMLLRELKEYSLIKEEPLLTKVTKDGDYIMGEIESL